jgi:competence protein ComEA
MNQFISKLFAVTMVVVLTAALMPAGEAAESPAEKININTAGSAELQQLPRIGPKVAQRILDYREQNGKFNRIEDLMKVRGIGEKTFESLKDLITVGNDSK